MKNNLQASKLLKIYNTKCFIESKKIELNKKAFKSITTGSWLEIESKTIEAKYITDNRIDANLILKVDGNYLYANIESSKKNKPYKRSRDKSSFTIKIKADIKIVQNGNMALSSLPADVVIARGGKDFAYANLYFNGSFLLEIKEVL